MKLYLKIYFSNQHSFHGKNELHFLFQLVMQNVKAAGEQIDISFDENDTADVDIIETNLDQGSGSGEHSSGSELSRSNRFGGHMLPNTRQIQPFQNNMVIIGKASNKSSRTLNQYLITLGLTLGFTPAQP